MTRRRTGDLLIDAGLVDFESLAHFRPRRHSRAERLQHLPQVAEDLLQNQVRARDG